MTDSADIVNRAVQLIGGYDNNAPVTGSPPTFDGTVIGLAAGAVYDAVVQTVGRQHGFDFSRNIVVLVETAGTPPLGYAFEYLYPTNGVQVRQLVPDLTDADRNNPQPVSWVIGNTIISGDPKKVIWTDIEDASAVFTNQPSEDLWDALFAESVVRLLANYLAAAVPGKPETAKDALSQAVAFEQIGADRDG